MIPQQSQFEIEVGWGRISGQIFGEQKPDSKPILSLHGFLDNSNSFRPLASFLTKNNNYYMIAIDLPGMGLSSKIPDGKFQLKKIISNYLEIISLLTN